jgi:hypothetical protein
LAATEAGSGIASFDIARSVDGGPYATWVSGTRSTSLISSLSPSHTYRFRVRSRDAAGNVSVWVEGLTIKPALVQQTTSAITYRGTWSTSSRAEYSGGSVRYTASPTATASYTFTGRGIGLVTTTGTTRGQVKVYIDGVLVRTVDLYSSSLAYRRLAFSQMFASSGTHTIKLVPVGTSGRPRIDLDAFAVIR